MSQPKTEFQELLQKKQTVATTLQLSMDHLQLDIIQNDRVVNLSY